MSRATKLIIVLRMIDRRDNYEMGTIQWKTINNAIQVAIDNI